MNTETPATPDYVTALYLDAAKAATLTSGLPPTALPYNKVAAKVFKALDRVDPLCIGVFNGDPAIESVRVRVLSLYGWTMEAFTAVTAHRIVCDRKAAMENELWHPTTKPSPPSKPLSPS